MLSCLLCPALPDKWIGKQYLLQMFLGERIEHAEAVVEMRPHVTKDLPGEAEWHPLDVMHVVCGRSMGQIPCEIQCTPEVIEFGPLNYSVEC